MVKLNPRLILQGISSVNFDKRDLGEAEKQFHKVTHLHLQCKNITKLTNLDQFENLTVLYLYENKITHIKGLYGAYNLEILYLQKNELDRVNGLTECTKLQKLYLGYNAIQCCSGLDTLDALQELHLEYQRLKPTDHLIMDPMSLNTLSTCLQLLDISGNQIETLEDFAGLQLHTLIARDNRLEDLDNTIIIISTLNNLRTLDLRENPITKLRKYRERTIGYSSALELLDDKVVTDCSRNFIQSFCRMKAARLKRIVDSYGELPEVTIRSTTIDETKGELSPRRRSSCFAENFEVPTGISSPMFKNQFNQELNAVERNRSSSSNNSRRQVKSRSLEFRVPPSKLQRPQEMAVPQFALAPPNFLREPQPRQAAFESKSSISVIFPANTQTLMMRKSRPLPHIEEIGDWKENEDESKESPLLDTEPEPPFALSLSTSEAKTDAEFVPQELTQAEAHYSEMIESDCPVSEFAKLILGLHEIPKATGDTSEFEQGKGISWTVMSPGSGSITDIQPFRSGHLQQTSFSEEPLSLQGVKAAPSRLNLQSNSGEASQQWERWIDFNLAENERQHQRTRSGSVPSTPSGAKSNSSAASRRGPGYLQEIPNNPYKPPAQKYPSKPSGGRTAQRSPQQCKSQQKGRPGKVATQGNTIPQVSGNGMIPIPVFQKQVYQLPPWPHIIKMQSSEPRITYMP